MKRIFNNPVKRTMKLLLIFTSFILLQISCSEEFLEPEPLSFYAPENVYVNKAGFEAGLVTVRRDFKFNEFYGNRNHLMNEYATSDMGYGISMHDMTFITPSSGTHMPILPQFSRIYGYIKNINVIISRIDNIEWASQEERNAILSEAYFFRAWWYWRLVTAYGDVPYIGYELDGPRLDFYTHSRWTILEKIIADMEFATEWLPESPENMTRPSKYAGFHLLSKLYLTNTEFDKAISAATSVINGPFALMTERFGKDASDDTKNLFWDLHRWENMALGNNTEAIMINIDRHDAPDGARTNGTYHWRGFHCPWWYTFVLDSEGKPGMQTAGPQYYALGRANPDVNQTRYFSYEVWEEDGNTWENTPDMRRDGSNWWEIDEILYNLPSSVDYGKPINLEYFSEEYQKMRIWPMPYYKTFYPHPPEYTGRPYGSNGDRYVFRLAETYLIRAEAHYWKGSLDQAAADINVIRERANAPLISAADVDIDYIFDERMRELFYEEFRHAEMVRVANIMAKLNLDGYSLETIHENNWWYDRKMEYDTWYKIGQAGPLTFKTTPRYIFWPIEISVITTNTMGVINQNKGYPGDELNIPPKTEIINEGRGAEDVE